MNLSLLIPSCSALLVIIKGILVLSVLNRKSCQKCGNSGHPDAECKYTGRPLNS